MAKGTWGDFPIVKLAGREFQRVPRSELPLLSPWRSDESSSEEDVLMPIFPEDDHLEFPGSPVYERHGPLIKAGIAVHKLDFKAHPDAWADTFGKPGRDPSASHFTAAELVILDELDWHIECANVLEAHGWLDRSGSLSSGMVDRVAEIVGAEVIDSAKERLGEDWTAYIGEIAAYYFAPPLSRLWYAANLMSLYYARQDDMRFGYLWCEYKARQRFELFALKHIEVTEKNRQSGQKGGQGDKKRERYEVLNRLARGKYKDLAFASDRVFIRTAKALASKYDAESDVPLFTVSGKPLSQKWYDEWAAQFRQLARGAE